MRLLALLLVFLSAACGPPARPADPGPAGLTFLDERVDEGTWRVRYRTGPEHDGFVAFPFMLHSLELAEDAGKTWLRPFRFEAEDTLVRDGTFTVQAYDVIPEGSVAFDVQGAGMAALDADEINRVVLPVAELRAFLETAVEAQQAAAADG